MDLVAEKKAVDEKLQSTEQKLRELEQLIEEEDRESSELGIHRHRLAQQLQDERLQHQKDLAERDFASNQTRKKYQCEHLRQQSETALIICFQPNLPSSVKVCDALVLS
jgi:myosin protein heavy chain